MNVVLHTIVLIFVHVWMENGLKLIFLRDVFFLDIQVCTRPTGEVSLIWKNQFPVPLFYPSF